MKKIIVKSALITLVAVIIISALSFVLWFFCAPQSVAGVCEKVGFYPLAVTSANRHYKKTDDTHDLARCAEDSILSGKDELIIEYCGALVEKADFDAVCADRNAQLSSTAYGDVATDYKGFILSNLAVAYYHEGKLESLDTALKVLKGCNAKCYVKLVVEVVEHGDKKECEMVAKELKQFEKTDYVLGLIALLEKVK